jgi:hypothetical protein
MKRKDEKLIAEAYQSVLENTVQQSPVQGSDKAQNAINALRQMSNDLQNPRLPNKENLIASAGNAIQTLSREPSPYQQQASQILKWLGQSQASIRGPQGVAARGFVASKLSEEINKLINLNAQQVKESSYRWDSRTSGYSEYPSQGEIKHSKYQKSDKDLVLAFAQEPKLSEITKLYSEPQYDSVKRGLHKQELTPQTLEHNLKFMAYGNKNAQFKTVDPEDLKAVYKAVKKKLETI